MAMIARFETTQRHTPEGDFNFMFLMSHNWHNRPFATNVFVEAPRGSNRSVISLALNERHIGFSRAVERARTIDTRARAVDRIARMRHALCDYATIPEHIHSAVIGNMGMLALAHGLRTIDLSHPDILSQLHPVLQEYDTQTIQRRETMHREIIEYALRPANTAV